MFEPGQTIFVVSKIGIKIGKFVKNSKDGRFDPIIIYDSAIKKNEWDYDAYCFASVKDAAEWACKKGNPWGYK